MSNRPKSRSRGEGSVFQRGRVWWVAYYIAGELVRESSRSPNKAAAVRFLRRRLGELGAGTYTGPSAEKVRFEDLAAMLRAAYAVEDRRSGKRAEQALANLATVFGGMRALEITLPRLTAYLAHRRAAAAAPATAAYELAILRRAFTLAVRSNLLPRRPAFPILSVENARQGFFEPADMERLLSHVREEIRGMLRFAYLTGWRIPSEVLPLRWDQVDFAAGVVRLEPRTTKNGEGRTFPLDVLPALAEVLRSQRAYTDVWETAEGRAIPWVFHRAGRQVKDFRDAWERACAKAGLAGRIPHDFRRSAVRNLERAGVSRSVAMKLTGHKTEAVYRRYAIVSESDLREGVAKLARSFTEHAQSEASD